MKLAAYLNSILRTFGVEIAKVQNGDSRRLGELHTDLIQKWGSSNLPTSLIESMLLNFKQSRSQLFQDCFALWLSSAEPNSKFFVEFGACNGLSFSNTILLETSYKWSGILCEPARMWHSDLEINRTAQIDKRCVWSHTGETLSFTETKIGELSTISNFVGNDYHASSRNKGKRYDVETISLNDLLEQHHAPKTINYLSIDTEGSEALILENFDFSKFKVIFVSVEHNFGSNRQRILEIMSDNNYRRVLESLSDFEDWYVLETESTQERLMELSNCLKP